MQDTKPCLFCERPMELVFAGAWESWQPSGGGEVQYRTVIFHGETCGGTESEHTGVVTISARDTDWSQVNKPEDSGDEQPH